MPDFSTASSRIVLARGDSRAPFHCSGGLWMARINSEDAIFRDQRFINLVFKLGGLDVALGSVVRAWMLSQQFWFQKELIPEAAWKGAKLSEELFSCDLAERRPEGIYVRGSSKNFDWYFKKTANLSAGAPAGGKARVLGAKRDLNGRLLPSKSTEAQPEASAQPAESSPSSSSSSSSSSSNYKNTTKP